MALAAQQQLNQALQEQQVYLRSLIESHPDALVMVDGQGVISDINSALERWTGRSRHDLIGAHWCTLFTDRGRAELCLTLAAETSQLNEFELTVTALDGNHIQVSCNATTLRDQDHRVRGVLVSARDATQRRFLDRAVQETHVALEDGQFTARRDSRVQSILLAQVSQALSAPLHALRVSLQALHAAPPALNAAQGLTAANIGHAATQLQVLLDQLLRQAALPGEMNGPMNGHMNGHMNGPKNGHIHIDSDGIAAPVYPVSLADHLITPAAHLGC
jgi:PAS domain S-box-containing protein